MNFALMPILKRVRDDLRQITIGRHMRRARLRFKLSRVLLRQINRQVHKLPLHRLARVATPRERGIPENGLSAYARPGVKEASRSENGSYLSRLRRIFKRGADVFPCKLRIGSKDLFRGFTSGKLLQDEV